MRKWGIIDVTSKRSGPYYDALARTSPLADLTGSWFVSEGAATILAAVIAALMVIVGYFIQQSFVRRERRARAYSEAVQAVEDYMEARS